jgi:diphosphomevalonate decarboxylase
LNFDTLSTQHQSSATWQSPSNIALVKYWGKKGFQIPANPSISFTLENCHTQTTLNWIKKSESESDFTVWVDGERKVEFEPKIQTFFKHISEIHPILNEFEYEIHTSNTFPHSSGIASSASGMSALALCVTDLLIAENIEIDNFKQFASNLARIGSGSACRSVYGKITMWGAHPSYEGSSDTYSIPFEAHPVFNTYQDTILIVHEGSKIVSSSMGHKLLENHPFSSARYKVANDNMVRIQEILRSGDLVSFTDLVESEALMLHGLMMTSTPSFVLMKPATLAIIEAIQKSRKEQNHNICFTLDAGANVHMLYPEIDKDIAEKLIQDQLIAYCENGRYICDNIGLGPKRLDA